MDGDDLISGPAAPGVLDEPTAPTAPSDDGPDPSGESDESTWASAGEAAPEELIPWWWPMTNYPGDEAAQEWLRKVFSFLIVAGSCVFVFIICQPQLIFRNTLPTGGDMGAHVWGPAYLRDYLLPHFRLSGWTPDWLGGFPAYTFYMVLPSLAIVILNVGLLPSWGVLLAVPLFGGLGWLVHRKLTGRVVRGLSFTVLTLLFFLSFHVPYDVSFKMVAVSGLVFFPAAIWYLGKGLALRAPMPELMAIASLPFLIDKSLFSIFGGNIASTMAGEFAFSISLTAGVFFLGVAARGMNTGRHRVLGACLLAVTLLCHVIPSIYVVTGTLIMMVLRIPWLRRITGSREQRADADLDGSRPGRADAGDAGDMPTLDGFADESTVAAGPEMAARPRGLKGLWARLPLSVRWVVPVGGVGGLIACFWYLPFYGLSAYLDDMGWQKYGLVTDAQGKMHASLTQYLGYLLPFGPHKVTLLGQTSTAEPNMLHGHVFFALAGIGVVLSIVMMVRAGVFFTLFGLAAAAGFVLMPQDRFWNARILPLYYLCIYMLAAIGLWLLVRLIPQLLDANWGRLPRWAGGGMAGAAAVLGFWMMRQDHQWNVWAQILAYFCIFSLATVALLVVGRPAPRVSGGVPMVWIGGALIALTLILGFWLSARMPTWTGSSQFAFYVIEFALAAAGVILIGRPAENVEWVSPVVWVGFGLVAASVIGGFWLMPHAASWNSSPKQFTFYLVEFALIGFGTACIVRSIAPGPSRQPAHWIGLSTVGIVAVVVLGVMLMSIRLMPGGTVTTDAKGVTTYHWGPFHSTYQGPVRDWVAWNFTGYEGKGAAWTELDNIRKTMTKVGQDDGCGRSFWEYSPDLNRFGSPMALMLLPYWTHSCIGSMEGLYMESSSTTPFHFTIQGELSQSPSDAQLWNIFDVDPATVYKGVQFDLGIQHLQMMGVRYFMASSTTVKADAAKDPRLKKLATTGTFDVYEVREASPLVEGLTALPAVWTNVGNPIHQWAKPAEEWFIDPSQWGVYRAQSGPAGWPRIKSGQTPKTVKVPKAKVTNITATRDTISFDVDRIGTPVVVKSSYFPDWQTNDADGPYRVAPNLMVVVPKSHHVVLTYGRSPIEVGAWVLTFIGLGLLLWMLRRGDPEPDDAPVEFAGDLDEESPRPTWGRDADDELGSEPDPDFEFDDLPSMPDPLEPEPVEPVEVPVGAGAGAGQWAEPGPPGDVPGG